MSVKIPISFGEYFDRLSILTLKAAHIRCPTARAEAARQKAALAAVPGRPSAEHVAKEVAALAEINAALWQAEEAVRATDEAAAFIEESRKIHRLNAHRTSVKTAIDQVLGSDFVELKDYGSDTS